MNAESKTSAVDYKGFKKDYHLLNAYLISLSSVTKETFSKWSRDEQLAFLINAYNAFTIQLIIKNYPVKSIRDIRSGLKGPWKIKFITLLEDTINLDTIEHEKIRAKGVYDEPRIHFALVCASIGCPPLLNEAFTPEKLEIQLENNVKRFLSDQGKNRYHSQTQTLEVSSIFKWFGSDFDIKYTSLNSFFAAYANVLTPHRHEQEKIKKNQIAISYLDYDWNLNDI